MLRGYGRRSSHRHCARSRHGAGRALAKYDHPQHLVLRHVRNLGGSHNTSVLHNADAVGEIEHVMDVVADEEDADTVGLELFDEFADLRRFLGSERRSRLVHDGSAD